MRRAVWTGCLIALVAASTLVVTAQAGGKPVSGGNPTPGTPQPEPPNLSDRITLTGCVQPAPKGTASSEAPDANTPTDARFVLTSATRVDRLPPGTGGSALAVKTNSRSYRLEGLDSQFSPFVNTKVEISGEIRARSSTEAAAAANVPTLLVEFVQKIASACP
jgi:hypothetical protein